VIHGEGRGKNLGFPTANLEIFTKNFILKKGVYFVEVFINDQNKISKTNDRSAARASRQHENDFAQRKKKSIQGLLFFGNKKTFNKNFSCEIFLLDFKKNIYDKILEVKILKFHRKVKKFDNHKLLIEAINQDIIKSKKFFLRKNIEKKWQKITNQKKLINIAIEKISQNKNFLEAKNIFAFAPIKNEISFIEFLIKKFPEKNYFFPKIINQEQFCLSFFANTDSKLVSIFINKLKKLIDKKNNLIFFRSRFENLVLGKFNILEPEGKKNKKICVENLTLQNFFYEIFVNEKIDPKEKNIIFVPAMAVDKKNNRLGKGGGFYDRILEYFPGPKISVVPDFCFLEKIPTELHDQRITEKIII